MKTMSVSSGSVDLREATPEEIKQLEAAQGIGQEKSLEDVQSAHQAANCDALAVYLATHPITWTDGEKYGVTLDDQQLMLLNLSTYKMGLASELKWNSHTKKCRVFTEEEFGLLTAAIDAFVRPRVERCQDYKEQIFQAQTIQEVEAITFDFDDDV